MNPKLIARRSSSPPKASGPALCSLSSKTMARTKASTPIVSGERSSSPVDRRFVPASDRRNESTPKAALPVWAEKSVATILRRGARGGGECKAHARRRELLTSVRGENAPALEIVDRGMDGVGGKGR